MGIDQFRRSGQIVVLSERDECHTERPESSIYNVKAEHILRLFWTISPNRQVRYIFFFEGENISSALAFFYYKVRWSVITKGDSFLVQSATSVITKCDRYSRVR